MSKFRYPTLVFKKNNVHPDHGRPYAFKQVWNDFDREALLGAGWSATIKEAMSGKPKPKVEAKHEPAQEPATIVPNDDEPPTRVELEAKAKELGINFDGRTSDAKLLKRINHHIESNK